MGNEPNSKGSEFRQGRDELFYTPGKTVKSPHEDHVEGPAAGVSELEAGMSQSNPSSVAWTAAWTLISPTHSLVDLSRENASVPATAPFTSSAP